MTQDGCATLETRILEQKAQPRDEYPAIVSFAESLDARDSGPIHPGGRVRRVAAVLIDCCLFVASWAVIETFDRHNAVIYATAIFVLIDIILTASLGTSPGRFVSGVRVMTAKGAVPGLPRALLRTALVLLTGWVGVLVFVSSGVYPKRMWWDAAAGTTIVGTARLPLSPMRRKSSAKTGKLG